MVVFDAFFFKEVLEKFDINTGIACLETESIENDLNSLFMDSWKIATSITELTEQQDVIVYNNRSCITIKGDSLVEQKQFDEDEWIKIVDDIELFKNKTYKVFVVLSSAEKCFVDFKGIAKLDTNNINSHRICLNIIDNELVLSQFSD